MNTHVFCRDLALTRGEPLAGSGGLPERVLLLAWPRRLWRPGRLGAGMSPPLAAAQAHAAHKTSHALFIDRVDRRGSLPQLLAFPENRFVDGLGEEALAQTIRRWADGGEIGGTPEPRITIICCTDSRTDACCARYGFATYKRLAREADPAVFNVMQCNHIGGCRFATSVAVLGRGERYGRLAPDEVPEFLAMIGAGRTYLPAFRGRSGLGEPQQVAEMAARRWAVTGNFGDGDVVLEETEEAPMSKTFVATIAGQQLSITIEQRQFHRHAHCDAVGGAGDRVSRWLVKSVTKA
ncbi:MAG TPA: sucrase ferredoxin [Devosiaceae bacterium]|jgi:hypothetical protein